MIIDPDAKQQTHLFKDGAGKLWEWTMQDVVEAGTPIDEVTGDDMEYLGIKKEENPVLKLEITICDGGVQDVVKIGGPANIDFEYDLVKLDTHE